MKRGKIILKKESKPEQKKSHKKSPKLNHQLPKTHHHPATPALLRASHRKRRAGAGVNGGRLTAASESACVSVT
jgi:hypothetical protein